MSRQDLLKHGKQGSAFEQLGALKGIERDYLPLSELKNVSFQSNDVFFAELARLQEMLRNLPLALPNEGKYKFEVSGANLHVYHSGTGIDRFQLFQGALGLSKMLQDELGVTFEFEQGNETVKVILHKTGFAEPSQGGSSSYAAARTSCPWRSSQWESQSAQACSESRGAVGSGER